jgi:hypothetical protein
VPKLGRIFLWAGPNLSVMWAPPLDTSKFHHSFMDRGSTLYFCLSKNIGNAYLGVVEEASKTWLICHFCRPRIHDILHSGFTCFLFGLVTTLSIYFGLFEALESIFRILKLSDHMGSSEFWVEIVLWYH